MCSVIILPIIILRHQLQITWTFKKKMWLSTYKQLPQSFRLFRVWLSYGSFLLSDMNHTSFLGLKTNRLMFLVLVCTSSVSYENVRTKLVVKIFIAKPNNCPLPEWVSSIYALQYKDGNLMNSKESILPHHVSNLWSSKVSLTQEISQP